MSRAEPTSEVFAIDRAGAAMIVGLAIVVGPGAIFASVAVLTHGFDLAATTIFEWSAAAIVVVVAALMIRAGVQELLGATGIRVDAEGIHQRGVSLRWAEIEGLAAPSYGVVEVSGAGKTLRLRTYLLRQPDGLHAALARHRGDAGP